MPNCDFGTIIRGTTQSPEEYIHNNYTSMTVRPFSHLAAMRFEQSSVDGDLRGH